jgi:quinol monooxygenase YgiN
MRLTFTAVVLLILTVPATAQDKEPDIITRLKKAKVDGPFTLVVVVQVKKGEEKTFLEAAKPCVAATRKEKGCIAYECHQDVEEPTRFVFYERWKSPEALAAHFKEEHLKSLADTLHKIADGAPKFAFLKLAE